RIAEVVNLEVLARAALTVRAVEVGIGRLCGACDDVGDARLAVPPIAVGDIHACYRRGDQRRSGRVGDIPHFMGYGTVLTQQIGFALDTVRQIAAVAQLRHSRTAMTGDQVLEVLRIPGVR